MTPGAPNDPSDDVRMVPILFSDAGTVEAACTFGFTSPAPPYADYGYPTTPRIYAYYPVGDDYAAFAAAAEAAVSDTPNQCDVEVEGDEASALINFGRGRPIQRDVLVQAVEGISMADLEGVVIRYYTSGNGTPDEPDAPAPDGLDLAAPFPNPAATRTAIRYTTGAAGSARLTVVDMLGRHVAVLADGDRQPGTHRAELETGRLAVGVYAVVLEAGGQRRVRMLTVAR